MLAGILFDLLTNRLELIEKLIHELDINSFLSGSLVKKKAFVQSVCRFASLLTFVRDNRKTFDELMQLESSNLNYGNCLITELIRFRNDFTHYYCYAHHYKEESLLRRCFELFKNNAIQTLKQKMNDYKQSIDKEKEEDFEEHGKRPTNRTGQQPANKALEEYIASIKYIVLEANELEEINNIEGENETYISLAKNGCCQNILQIIEDTDAMFLEESVLNLIDETCENILNKNFPALQIYFGRYIYKNDRIKLAHDYLYVAPEPISEDIIGNCFQVGEFYKELVKQLEEILKSSVLQESSAEDSPNEKDEFGRKILRRSKSSSDSERDEQDKPMHKKHKGDKETSPLVSSTYQLFHTSYALTTLPDANEEKLLGDKTKTDRNKEEKESEAKTHSSPRKN